MGIVLGIDASRNRSGGAKAHLLGIIGEAAPMSCEVVKIHVWSYKALLDALPDRPWLVKHNPHELERSIFHQLKWQYRDLPREVRDSQCDILLNTDAGSICRFRPAVVMSRDMLSYEPGEMARFGLSKARVRLVLLRFIQSQSLKFADGVIFLTKYAAEVIQRTTGDLSRVAIIPHGVGVAFKESGLLNEWPKGSDHAINCLYVSNAAMYKHQWNVVRAIGQLRKRGYNVHLTLAGGGEGKAQRLLDDEISKSDPHGEFVSCIGFVRHDELPVLLKQADIFIFASSCENMPNTLVEAMATGLPIACSDRGPMPEVLADGGVYFNPENPGSIFNAVETIINNPTLRESISNRAKELSEQYSWTRCAKETLAFLVEISGARK